jgi:hypothetical protein
MKTSYWIAIVVMSSVTAFIIGLAAEYLSTAYDIGPWKCV